MLRWSLSVNERRVVEASGGSTRRSGDGDPDDSRLDFDGVGAHRFGGGPVQYVASPDVEHAGVQWALDRPLAPVGIDLTLAQIPTAVRALVIDGVELAVHV